MPWRHQNEYGFDNFSRIGTPEWFPECAVGTGKCAEF
jgi:hypothetical protein